jgi:hypothetical protein
MPRRMRIQRSRLRRAEPPPNPEPTEPQVGVRSPGVRARRLHEPRELDWNERLRRSLRGSTSGGAPFWRG